MYILKAFSEVQTFLFACLCRKLPSVKSSLRSYENNRVERHNISSYSDTFVSGFLAVEKVAILMIKKK